MDTVHTYTHHCTIYAPYIYNLPEQIHGLNGERFSKNPPTLVIIHLYLFLCNIAKWGVMKNEHTDQRVIYLII